VAQQWAENCAARGMMYHSHDHANDNENIYGSWQPKSQIKGRDSVDAFYSEVKYYQFGRMEFSMQTGKV
jgi:glioma pathogenesis-related protein 2